jgi:hypothetical protein
MAPADIAAGLISTPLKIDHHRSLSRHAHSGGERVPRCVSRAEDRPSAMGFPLCPRRRRCVHGQRHPYGQLRGRRAGRR